MENTNQVREFETGATRSSDVGKPEYEGYLSPLVIRRFGQYMLKHQVQADGRKRAADNWQKRIPKASYMGSLWRHFLNVWGIFRGAWGSKEEEDIEDALCGVMFNAMGLLHETLRSEEITHKKSSEGILLRCITCKYATLLGSSFPCSDCDTPAHSLWEPKR